MNAGLYAREHIKLCGPLAEIPHTLNGVASSTEPGAFRPKADMSNEEKAKAYIAEIKRMNKAMNIPEKLDFIKEEDIPTLVKRALKEGNPGYPVPRIMTKKDCEQVIRSLMA